MKLGLIESVGKEYMLTARVYDMVKSDIDYARDKVVRYIKAKEMILEYLDKNEYITSAIIQELCGFSKQQARSTLDKMRKESLIEIVGAARQSKYIRVKLDSELDT